MIPSALPWEAKNFLALVWALALFLATVSVANADNSPIVFASTETPPYWSPTLPDDGLGGSLLKLLSANAGVKYSFEYLPLRRFRESTAPFIVGDPDFLAKQHRRAIFPIGVFQTAFFYYKPHHEKLDLHSFKDLKGLTLGVLRGTLDDKDYFVRSGIGIEESSSTESLLRMLKKGRIDVCILVFGTGRDAIQKLYPQEKEAFVLSVIPKLTRPLAVMIDVANPEGRAAAERYHKVLKSTLHSQRYQEILENFYGKNNIPSDRDKQLNQFLQLYASTWEY
jgi:polar amino acid transport system substrate-binding protein